ncbi:MAG TPA: FAD-dependent tricarballylate dehydrogenase TcuA [Galbitalea sp.]|jgi:tricarballylate dehydrogenase|nr:FAD-dependent tricarballylate dehydrogenase TcuA [Galbitalea sp.]
MPHEVDVLVVGCGNAALCSALAAHQAGATVMTLEKSPRDKRGGNGIFTGGLVRFAYGDIDGVRTVVDMTDEEANRYDVGTYTSDDFFEDVASLGGYRADPDLLDTLTSSSLETMQWLRSLGVPFAPSLGLHAFQDGDKIVFRGNAPVEVSGGGLGLVEHLAKTAEAAGIQMEYDARATALTRSGERWDVTYRQAGIEHTVSAGAVVLASGGFEANRRMRAQYLGPGWDLAKVRGSEFNTGDGHRLAESVGAAMAGHWSGCHATPWDAEAPMTGDRKLLHAFTRHSYIFGVMVNAEGVRFVDEGQDLETHTYAKFGREILAQPGAIAYQIFDADGFGRLRNEYASRGTTHIEAPTLPELATKLGLGDRMVDTIEEYNAATDSSLEFDAGKKDGKSTRGLPLPKSNWATPVVKGPFHAYPVTCGITFTYGGLKVDAGANVIDEYGDQINGLFAAGEILGGLFYHNYPTATGITTGAVFGKTAGTHAADRASTHRA